MNYINPLQNKEKNLIPLTSLYKEIELPARNFNKHFVHLYPSEDMLLVYNIHITLNSYYKNIHTSKQKKYEYFDDYLYENRPIDVDKRTGITRYHEKNYLMKYKNVTIENNQLIRNGKTLYPGDYIYIIDQNGHLLITREKITRKGRIHHTSLSRGDSVQAAGVMKINARHIELKNCSEAYKPPCENLVLAMEWLKDNGLNYTIASDRTILGKKTRTVKLALESTSMESTSKFTKIRSRLCFWQRRDPDFEVG